MSELSQNPKNSVPAYVFRFALERGHCSTQSACLKGANKRHHSITSSARASSIAGISRPSAFAVLRLMLSSNLVGW